MKVSKQAVIDLPILSPLVKDYLTGKLNDIPLQTKAPSIADIESIIANKQFDTNTRKVLVEVLTEQCAPFELSLTTQSNLELLAQENTYTVTTAHQLCLFTGPLYFIYKILSAIQLCNTLKVKYPNQNFVPIYWMGSEDHDFEEINHAHVYGKKVAWNKEAKGAVGRLRSTEIEETINALADILGEQGNHWIAKLNRYFNNEKLYGQNFQHFVLDLFKDYGLLVLDQDDTRLKALFANEMAQELTNSVVKNSNTESLAYLNKHYHIQANPRDINLFYLRDDLRERIERVDGNYLVVNTDIQFSERDILEDLQENPARFSPNVSLRPMYQEKILPNVAFIGGPGEIAYWLPLKDTFTAFDIPMPMLLLRDMALILNKGSQNKMADWKLSIADLFKDKDEITKSLIHENSDADFTLSEEQAALTTLFDELKAKAVAIDKNLERSVEGEKQKSLNALKNVSSKLIRAEKKNQEDLVNGVANLKDKLFPNYSFQERYENFTPYYLKYGKAFFDVLLENFNAFEGTLKVIEE